MPRHVCIIGAGISGLTAAWQIQQLEPDAEVSIFESANRVGGLIRTQLEPTLLELGPRGVRPKGSGLATLALIEELGLQDQVVCANAAAEERYLWLNSRLQKLPHSVGEAFCSPLTRRHLFTLAKECLAPAEQASDISLYDLIEKRFSKAVCERFLDPFVSGVFAGDARKLSARSAFPVIWEASKKGSILRNMKGSVPQTAWAKSLQKTALLSFKQGMQQLTDTIATKLRAQIYLNTHVQSFTADSVTLSDGAVHKADLVIAAHRAPFCEHVSIYVVSMMWKNVASPLPAFGYLVPSSEKEEVLGCVLDSVVFPEQGRKGELRLSVMIKNPSRDVIAIAQDAVKKHLGLVGPCDFVQATFWKDAIAQYPVGFYAEQQRRAKDSILWLGASLYGCAVNDCIQEARSRVEHRLQVPVLATV